MTLGTLRTAAAALLLASGALQAQSPKTGQMTQEEFEAKLGYQTGTITLRGGMATIRLPESFRFIGPAGSKLLLTEGWGNPESAAEGVLGMLIPTSASPLDKEGWGIAITYDEDGYVADDEAAKMDYTKLMKQMKEGTAEENTERTKQGIETVNLVGWAEPPRYDAASHKMFWAKDLVFGSNTDHTLNYDIRILGRRGVLVLNAISSLEQLPAIKTAAPAVLAAVDFNEGHRYADYVKGTDKAATYGIVGLIAGATAVKAGLFKALWLGILAFKKVIVVAVIAAVAGIRKMLAKKEPVATASPSDTAV
jgi:uncharacterized membrane-anchored protein